MGCPQDSQVRLEEAKARFLEEAGKLTPSEWIRKHPDTAVGGAVAAGLLLGFSDEAREETVKKAAVGLRLARAFLSGLKGNSPGGS